MSGKQYLDTECMTEISAKQWNYVIQANLAAREEVRNKREEQKRGTKARNENQE